ncbi:galactitol-1-phosphate 5-dehydrogenase [Pectinatus haikarae]|uniref:galactitol-1-phosphate 5-dehydrogenase n=1 Tax=Pectinatus haikarae TaxID=349096 RepID=UPI0018C7BD8E|nr:galactitol-1-phosphate 5-dehydrogenase [Pectinatus haikarae]
MKALCLYGVRDIRFENVDEPQIKNDCDVKIKVKAVGICGSDIHRYSQLGPYVKGMVWGHEFSGQITEVGRAVTKYTKGQKVTACPALCCEKCDPCKKGRYAQCEELSVIGAYRQGAFAEYIVLPENNVVALPDTVDYAEAALIEPSCVALHGIYNAGGIQPGSTAAVLGCGTVGTMAVQWAAISGAEKIIAIDVNQNRLQTALKVGADIIINTAGKDPYDAVCEMTGGKGVDFAVEAAGTAETSAQVLALPGKGGAVIYMGIPYSDVLINRFHFERIVRNELSVYGTWNAISGPFPGREWETCVHFLGKGILKTAPLISRNVPLSEGPEVFAAAADKYTDGKIVFRP